MGVNIPCLVFTWSSRSAGQGWELRLSVQSSLQLWCQVIYSVQLGVKGAWLRKYSVL